jgi:hypothetical protein
MRKCRCPESDPMTCAILRYEAAADIEDFDWDLELSQDALDLIDPCDCPCHGDGFDDDEDGFAAQMESSGVGALMPHWLPTEYRGFTIHLDPHGNGDFDTWLYDDEWDFDHGQIARCQPQDAALRDAKQMCDAIRAEFSSKEDFEAREEEAL